MKIGMCNACHPPHKSANANLLVQNVPGLCFSCHSDEGFVKERVHQPVAEGKCFACHGNHASQYGNLMRLGGNAVCKQCHESVFQSAHPRTGFVDERQKTEEPQEKKAPTKQQKKFGDDLFEETGKKTRPYHRRQG